MSGRFTSQTRIFVCYSRADELWVKAGIHGLIPWLSQALERHKVTLWADSALLQQPGVDYAERILEEIRRASFALLLISQDFMDSRFIREIEFPLIRQRVESGEMALIPVLVGPTLWGYESEEISWLLQRQMLPGRPTPLIEYTRDPVSWQNVRIEILQAIINRVQDRRVRPTAGATGVADVEPAPREEHNATGTEAQSEAPISAVAIPGQPTVISPAHSPPGLEIGGRYRTQAFLASTDFSQVYRAWDMREQTPVALKIIDMERTPGSSVGTVSLPAHPRIAARREIWQEGSLSYEVLDFVPGWSLAALLAANSLSLGQGWIEAWAEDLLELLVYFHSQSPAIVHCDIKPANLIVHATERHLVLIDLSLAAQVTTSVGRDIIVSSGYSAPELYQGSFSPASDVYSWGATISTLITGRVPPDAVLRTMGRNLPNHERMRYEWATELALKAMSLKPEDRGSAKQLLSEIQRRKTLTRVAPDPVVWFAGTFAPLDPDLGVSIDDTGGHA